jgi:hypothetical protein
MVDEAARGLQPDACGRRRRCRVVVPGGSLELERCQAGEPCNVQQIYIYPQLHGSPA